MYGKRMEGKGGKTGLKVCGEKGREKKEDMERNKKRWDEKGVKLFVCLWD